MRTIQCSGLNSTITTARKIIMDNTELSFVAIATNPWHALSIDAALSRNKQATPGVIIITSHASKGYLINPSSFSFEGRSKSVFLKSDTDSTGILVKSKKGTETLSSFILSTISYSDSKRTFRVISPEKRYRVVSRIFAKQELVSTLQPRYITLEYSIGKLLNNPFMSDNKSVPLQLYDSIASSIESIYFKIDRMDRRNLFYLQNGQLMVNSDVASDYQRVLGENSTNKENKILFVSQPFVEQNMMTESKFEKLIQYTMDHSQQNYEKVLIKPHPREDIDKLSRTIHSKADIDIHIIEQEQAVERLIPTINPEAIIGCTSSSLVKSSVFFDIDAYSTADIASNICKNENFVQLCSEFLDSVAGLIKPLR